MTLDDETLLTAYLDGELDAAGRNRVEAAVASSPRVARRLRDLAEARDLVEGLARPSAPRDLSATIVGRLTAPPRPWAFRVRAAQVVSPRWVAIGASLSVAASLLVAPSLFSLLGTDLPGRLLNRSRAPATIASAPEGGGKGTERPVEDVFVGPPRAMIEAARALAEADEKKQIEDDDRIRRLLERGDVIKVRVPVDRIDRSQLALLERVIGDSPRKNPVTGRITVPEGVVIDPSAPNGAMVYALVLDDKERALLLGKFSTGFDGPPIESTPSRDEVMLLAGLDRVAVDEGKAAGTLSDPPPHLAKNESVALQTPPEELTQPRSDGGRSLHDPLSIKAGGPRPKRPKNVPKAAAPAPEREPMSRTSTVLIWLVPKQPSVGETGR